MEKEEKTEISLTVQIEYLGDYVHAISVICDDTGEIVRLTLFLDGG